MFKRWKAFLAKHQSTPEESVVYRIAITVLVMFALLLTLHQLEWPSFSAAILTITPAASLLSYYRRAKSNFGLKIFLSFAMMALLLWFFGRLAASLHDPRIPLAELLIWLQTLHAFDLPAKKDLRYTGLVALILMAIACVLTYSTYFAPLLMLFCVLFLSVLAIDFWAGNRTPNTLVHRESAKARPAKFNPKWVGGAVGKTLPLALLGGAIIFLFMPRYQGLKLRTLPMNWNVNLSLNRFSDGQIRQPEGSGTRSNSAGKPERVDGDSYFGFDSEVNLNARGQMSDAIVLKVRTSNWQYHRAVTFAKYDGFGWKGLPQEPRQVEVRQPPFYFPFMNWKDERVTIYYAEADLPNIIFTPIYPRRLYFPSNEIFILDSFEKKLLPKNGINTPATLVSPFYLEQGAVYSVLNQVPEANIRRLNALSTRPEGEALPDYLEIYAQLPDTVTERTRELAASLVKDKTSDWAKAAKLTAHLQQNYTYDLEVGFYPEGADTADHFLFEERVGYCEQFATSLCVLARSVGLPARYVTGYLPGSYNPLSGFYEVKASDAHAWAEIYIKGYGWMIFDPVPGENGTPLVGEGATQEWLLEALLEYLKVPIGVRKALPNLLRVFVGLAIFTLILALIRPKSKRGENSTSEFAPYLHQAEALVGARLPGETVLKWSQRLGAWPQLAILAQAYQEHFYRDLELDSKLEAELKSALSDLKAQVQKKQTQVKDS